MTATKLKRALSLIALAGLVGGGTIQYASAQTVVSPSIYEDVDAPNASGDGWFFSSRSNFIFHKSEFADLPVGGAMLSELSVRPDSSSRIGDEFSFGRIEISVAVTPMEPQDISLTYAENIEAAISPPVVVYDGPWSTTVTSDRPQGDEARPFEHRAALQNLFHYDPADGNLLVDWIFEDPISPQGTTDLEFNDTAEDIHAHVWGNADAANADSDLGIYSVMTELSFVAVGDFDRSGALDVADIDLLSAEVRADTNSINFDLTGDGQVDDSDREHWVDEIRKTFFGDANLDGEFSSLDFVVVFQAGKFETGQNAGWSEGDWNGDGVFSSGDFVRAFQDGGYEQGPRPVQTVAVPEPSGVILLLASIISLALLRRR